MTVIPPEVAREIEDDRLSYRDHEIEAVVSASIAYHAELDRKDGLHRARLSVRWHELLQAILSCADAHRELRAPITNQELEMHEALKRIKR
jgi:hypothetical protein